VIGNSRQVKIDVDRHSTNQPPQNRSLFQQPSGIRREAMSKTPAIRETSPSRVVAASFGVQLRSSRRQEE
jgi:hypothetical protein